MKNPLEIVQTNSDRRGFMRMAGMAGAVGGVAALLGGTARAQGFGGGDTRRTFEDIRRHENAHVAFLVTALEQAGITPRPKPDFIGLVQPNFRAFFQVAQDLENTGVGAYLGAAPSILTRPYLAAAGSIALIEARHAGWLNSLVGVPITTNVYGMEQSFEKPLTDEEVLALAGPFIADLNGGPPVGYATYEEAEPSLANDVAILQFALALEYLEAEFYNLNARLF